MAKSDNLECLNLRAEHHKNQLEDQEFWVLHPGVRLKTPKGEAGEERRLWGGAAVPCPSEGEDLWLSLRTSWLRQLISNRNERVGERTTNTNVKKATLKKLNVPLCDSPREPGGIAEKQD